MIEHSEEKISTAKQDTQSSTHCRLWKMRFQGKKKEGKFLKVK